MFLDHFLSLIVYLRFISLKFAATSLVQFVCYSTLFRLLCSKSHNVCSKYLLQTFISLKFAATSLVQFVCYSNLFRLLCSKSHNVCSKYFRLLCFLSCISSFHSCHLYSVVTCKLVLFLATVIVILFYCNKGELEPWTIRYNSKAKTYVGIWENEVINGWNSGRNCRLLRQPPVPIGQGNSRIVHITRRKCE